MQLVVCSVRDRATEAFMRPFYVHRPAEAVRSFTDEVRRKADPGQQNLLNSHPTDYELFSLAVFDDQTGEFRPAMERLARGEDLVL